MIPRVDESENQLLKTPNGIKKSSIFDGNQKAGRTDEKLIVTSMETKVYNRRWLQLGLFFLCNAVNTMQWIQFTIIGNVISRYYGVSSLAVDWTSTSVHVSYVVLLFPASYVMDRVGLRWTCLFGSIGTSIGAWIKVFAVSPDRFLLLFIGQLLVLSSQIFVLNVTPRLAANWFGPKEVATATALGGSGGTAGVSLFFFITPIIVKNHLKIEDIGQELFILLLAVAVVCTIVTAALFLFFQDEPVLPPSEARALRRANRKSESEGFWSTFKRISTNKSFIMLWNSYGMNIGYLNAASTLLNPLFLAHFQNGETDAGKLGLLMNLPGNFASIFFAVILDKTKKFKAISIFIYVFSLVGQISFAFGLVMELRWLVFVSVVIIGIFTISNLAIGYELCAEATYPEPEEISLSLLNMSPHVYGTTLILIVGSLLRTFGDRIAHGFLTAILALGLALTFFTKIELRRQKAQIATTDHYEPILSSEIIPFDKGIGENENENENENEKKKVSQTLDKNQDYNLLAIITKLYD